ncbi:hypothetical protein HOY82DRAFT_673947 [Tuber indicum]|nr:hypothetical protein HOY82DRAFT_673947 [Tuber indicum]
MQADEHAKPVLDADDGLDCEALALEMLALGDAQGGVLGGAGEAEESLGDKMARKVYKEYLIQKKLPDPRGRTGSDNSGASSSGAQHHLADDDTARAMAEGDVAVQKFAGDFNELVRAYLPHVLRR